MDLTYSEQYQAFRQEVQRFIAEHRHLAPKEIGLERPSEEQKRWQRLLIEHGYAARTIPKEYGGFGAPMDVLEQFIIADEFSTAGVSQGLSGQGIAMLVPTLLELGTEEQKKRYIPPTIRGDMIWCQGYSEPNAGSDLASLRTSARVEGDFFVINGQKIWTSSAHFADMMFCLVRTEPDAPKHKGISYLLIPMTTPGIEVRPLMTMTGDAIFNEVFFTDVKVPITNIVGQRGEGWKVANATLIYERGMLGDPNQTTNFFKRLVEVLQRETIAGESVMTRQPQLRERLLRLQGRVLAMRFHGLRLLTHFAKMEMPGVAMLVVKLYGTVLNHELAALAIDAMGELGTLYDKDPMLRDDGLWQRWYMFSLGLIIGGGTSQIQKNIISERGLGMPREPRSPEEIAASTAKPSQS